MMTKDATGYAFIDAYGINVKTVSPTERAAMVNTLAVVFGCLATNTIPDDRIRKLYAEHNPDNSRGRIAPVNISVVG